MRRTLLILGVLLLARQAFADPCLDCHLAETPGAVRQWQQSAHAGKVGCAGCHGEDHQGLLDGQRPVRAAVCGRCHEAAYRQHRASRHGLSLQAGWGCTRNSAGAASGDCNFCHEKGSTRPRAAVQCARFLAQTPEMQTLGCNRCHQVENSCASCHSNHLTDLSLVRQPAICATCHMGPDHPQWEMWQTSRHGVLFDALGADAGPGCQQCHMPNGSHDVSSGITLSPGLQPLDAELRQGRREEMVALCGTCHARGFAERELGRGDAVRIQSAALVREAEEIIRDLADRGLLTPALGERPPHPLRGDELVLDGQMLYEGISHIERLFFKMKKFDLAQTVKGAYHQNPAYAHWYGNAELKMTLVDIRAEAERLKQAGAGPPARGAGPVAVEAALHALKARFSRGAITPEQYRSAKSDLLDSLAEQGRQ